MASRAIPDDNLAYPVLITFKNGSTGSGFYLNVNNATFLVTAKHVLFDPSSQTFRGVTADLLSYGRDPANQHPNLIEIDLSVLQSAGDIRVHASEDVVVVKIGTETQDANKNTIVRFIAGATLKESAGDMVGVPLGGVKTFDKVLIGNEVIVFGYPTSIGIREIPQLDSARPLLRRGIVAGENLRKRSIVLDCPSYPGNSGGPVLQVEQEGLQTQFSVIGVISQFVPYAETWFNEQRGYTNTSVSNSGYSIAIPMDFVLELLPH